MNKEKILEELWRMLKFRDEAINETISNLRNAKLVGAIQLVEALGFFVVFDPLAREDANPFKLVEKEVK